MLTFRRACCLIIVLLATDVRVREPTVHSNNSRHQEKTRSNKDSVLGKLALKSVAVLYN